MVLEYKSTIRTHQDLSVPGLHPLHLTVWKWILDHLHEARRWTPFISSAANTSFESDDMTASHTKTSCERDLKDCNISTDSWETQDMDHVPWGHTVYKGIQGADMRRGGEERPKEASCSTLCNPGLSVHLFQLQQGLPLAHTVHYSNKTVVPSQVSPLPSLEVNMTNCYKHWHWRFFPWIINKHVLTKMSPFQ